jgi:hypothetical protein
MADKPWSMTGEVAGAKRPENSLLEVDAEWDTVRRAAPEVVTYIKCVYVSVCLCASNLHFFFFFLNYKSINA